MSDAFWNNLPALLIAIFGGIGSAFSVLAAIRAKQAVEVSKAGNADAAKAADAAVATAQKVDDHNATTSRYVLKGIERSEFERAIAIGEMKGEERARSNFGTPTDLGKLS